MGVHKLSAIALLCASVCAFSISPAQAKKHHKVTKITILHSNDTHGRYWKNSDGEFGQAARSTLINEIRQEVKAAGGHVLVIDAGDVNTGVPESDLQNAKPDFTGMNTIGYHAMALGNHEFDKPLSVLQAQIKLAKFPLLSANILNKKTKKPAFTPYTILRAGNARVAVLGLTTPDTQKMVSPENVKSLSFVDASKAAKQYIPQLRKKADMVIVASHLGYYADAQHGTSAPGDVTLARNVKGIDLIVGGHSHTALCMKAPNVLDEAYTPGQPCQPDVQNGATIVQAGQWGRFLGRADYEVSKAGARLVRYELIPVNLKKTVKGADGKNIKVAYTRDIPEDSQVLEALQPFQEKGQTQLGVKIGRLTGVLNGKREDVRTKPTNLGVMIARSMMQRTNADFAIMNSGGVRDSINEGDVTYRDVLKVQPFGNTIVSVDLKGTEVMELLNTAAKMTPGSGAFPQFAGITLEIANGVVSKAQIKGQDIDPQKTYRVALNNFVAAGGDGYPKYKNHPSYVDTGYVDAEVLKAMFLSGPINAADYEPGNEVVRK